MLLSLIFGQGIKIYPSFSAEQDSVFALSPHDYLQIREKLGPRIPQVSDQNRLKVLAAKAPPLLVSLEGVAKVSVRGVDGTLRQLGPGQTFQIGDSLMSGLSGTLRIAFEEGAQILITPNSFVTLLEQVILPDFPPVTRVEVKQGEIRVLVERSTFKVPPASSPSPHRFFVGTPSAVMGVRGTDFIISVGEVPSKMEIHTVTGIVDIAKDMDQIRQGNFYSVPTGLTTFAFKNSPVEKPMPFILGPYLQELNDRYPVLQQMWKKATREARTGQLKKKFEQLKSQGLSSQKFLQKPPVPSKKK